MVARGDLGVEMGYAELTGLQKTIIQRVAHAQSRRDHRDADDGVDDPQARCRRARKSRDVANAVHGRHRRGDAVRRERASANTRSRPSKAMAQVILGAEKYELAHSPRAPSHRRRMFESTEEAIAMAVMYTANHLKVRAIVALTESGSTPLWMSRIRSDIPIYAFTRHEVDAPPRHAVSRRLSGDVRHHATATHRRLYADIFKLMLQSKMVEPGDRIILTKGELTGVVGQDQRDEDPRSARPDSPTHASAPNRRLHRRSRLVALLVRGVRGRLLARCAPACRSSTVRSPRGLQAPATIARDELGTPTIRAASRRDLAFATGYAHGQDRFFQMDLMRRARGRRAGGTARQAGDRDGREVPHPRLPAHRGRNRERQHRRRS